MYKQKRVKILQENARTRSALVTNEHKFHYGGPVDTIGK